MKGINHIFLIDPLVVRSLNKSVLRKKILLYLSSIYPRHTYLSEIARNVRSDPSNVLGCLRGMGNRYNGNSSLIELGLVEQLEADGYKYYRASEFGKQVAEYIKEVYF